MAFAPPVRRAGEVLGFHPGTGQRAASAAAGHFPMDTAGQHGLRRQLKAAAAASEAPQVGSADSLTRTKLARGVSPSLQLDPAFMQVL